MPQLQTIALADRQATPVTHTYIPRQVDPKTGVGTCSEYNGISIGEATFTASGRKSGTRFKSRFVLAIPIVQNETINGVTQPKVVRTGYCDVNFSFMEGSTEQERNDLVGQMLAALGPTKLLVNDVVIKQQGVY